jgi:hypothetical protein
VPRYGLLLHATLDNTPNTHQFNSELGDVAQAMVDFGKQFNLLLVPDCSTQLPPSPSTTGSIGRLLKKCVDFRTIIYFLV